MAKSGRHANGEYIRPEPFQAWLNARVAYWEGKLRGAQDANPIRMVCEEIGWPYVEGSVRRIYRYRHGLKETKVGRKRVIVPATSFPREVVEDALHSAGVDFYEMYPELGHERNGLPEPEAWCCNCADHVLVVRNKAEEPVCIWCSWKIGDGHMNGLELAA